MAHITDQDKKAILLVVAEALERVDSTMREIQEVCDRANKRIAKVTRNEFYRPVPVLEDLKSDLNELRHLMPRLRADNNYVTLGRSYAQRIFNKLEDFETEEEQFDKQVDKNQSGDRKDKFSEDDDYSKSVDEELNPPDEFEDDEEDFD